MPRTPPGEITASLRGPTSNGEGEETKKGKKREDTGGTAFRLKQFLDLPLMYVCTNYHQQKITLSFEILFNRNRWWQLNHYHIDFSIPFLLTPVCYTIIVDVVIVIAVQLLELTTTTYLSRCGFPRSLAPAIVLQSRRIRGVRLSQRRGRPLWLQIARQRFTNCHRFQNIGSTQTSCSQKL